MLNRIFVAGMAGSVLLAAWGGRMEALTRAILDAARDAVDLALGLVGALALFLGLARLAADAGLLTALARRIGPWLGRIVPGVPADHPAMSSMVLNLSSNLLGLGNAATPFGLQAMRDLDTLNAERGTATNAMVVFLALNTAGLSLLPTSVLALRGATGSSDVAGVLLPTWIAGAVGTLVAVASALLLQRLPRFRVAPPRSMAGVTAMAPAPMEAAPIPPRGARGLALLFWGALLAALAWFVATRAASQGVLAGAREAASTWPLPVVVAGLVVLGWARGARAYDSVVAGAKEGFEVALRILPSLVAILVLAAMVRAAGGMDLLAWGLAPVTAWLGVPAELVPLALLRPLSGSGAYGVLGDLLRAHGPDSFVGFAACAVHGSTETTFYVLAIYFGAAGVTRTRHALYACLCADVAAMAAAVAAARLVWSGPG